MPDSVVDVAKSVFVDGLTLAAATGSVLVFVAMFAVKRYLPSDKHDEAITGRAEPIAVAGD